MKIIPYHYKYFMNSLKCVYKCFLYEVEMQPTSPPSAETARTHTVHSYKLNNNHLSVNIKYKIDASTQ